VSDLRHVPPGLHRSRFGWRGCSSASSTAPGSCWRGAALAAQFLTTRPTQDLDFFTGPDLGNIPKASAAFETAVRANGWSIRRVRDSPTFHRMVISGPQDVLVDLALDAPPAHAAVPSVAGPTFALEELAGRKVVALFDPNGSPTPA
jgi:hypothetical protein